MTGSRFTLARVLGIEIRLDLSWLVLFLLLVWSLSRGVFPFRHGHLTQPAYWLMGAVAVLGLFASIVIHELGHALVARRYRMTIRRITLFIFGGVAELEDEPPSPRAELLVALSGPAVSLLLGGILLQLAGLGRLAQWPATLTGALGYLADLNLAVALFNLLPASPLDGGRVLHAVLWSLKRDLRAATRIAVRSGTVFGILLSLLGIYELFRSDVVGGLWLLLLGVFLQGAARHSHEQQLLRRAFTGQTVRRVMRTDPLTVSCTLTVQELVDDYFYRHPATMFPVVDEDLALGCVTLEQVAKLPRTEWSRTFVEQLVSPCCEENTLSPQADLLKALGTLRRSGRDALVVVDEERVVGVLTLPDILNFLAIKLELDGVSASGEGATTSQGLQLLHASA